MYTADKFLQQDVLNYMVDNGYACFADAQKQSIYVYFCSNFQAEMLKQISDHAGDNVLTLEEVQTTLRGSQFEKIPF